MSDTTDATIAETTDDTIAETTDDTPTAVTTAVEPAQQDESDGISTDRNTEVEPVEVSDGADRRHPEPGDAEPDEAADTFPREYVERLRRESQNYRERATKGDTYAQRLHTELVRATGKLADPTDLPFDAEHLDDPDVLAAAVDDLLARKPHLATRKPGGDIGQGLVSGNGSGVDLAAILRQKAQ